MSSLTASTIATPAASLPLLRLEGRNTRQPKPIGLKLIGTCPIRLKPLSMQFQNIDRRAPVMHAARVKSPSIICAAALSSRCAAEQTQTVTREQTTITVAPIQGKEKSPELDDGGSGFPPRDDGDGGGGGGGGGGGWTGGFFFFGFLAFLGFLKDQESEGPYRDDR